jgi:hypothetical protein
LSTRAENVVQRRKACSARRRDVVLRRRYVLGSSLRSLVGELLLTARRRAENLPAAYLVSARGGAENVVQQRGRERFSAGPRTHYKKEPPGSSPGAMASGRSPDASGRRRERTTCCDYRHTVWDTPANRSRRKANTSTSHATS